MMMIFWIISAIMATYMAIGLIGIMIWEITSEIMGAFRVPSWIDKMYNFIVDKMFFFFN